MEGVGGGRGEGRGARLLGGGAVRVGWEPSTCVYSILSWLPCI